MSVDGRSFGARLTEAVARHGALCVGIDPHPALLDAWGLTDDARGLAAFADVCLEALAGHVATVKPQSAFFERHGSAGVAVLERLLADLSGTPTLSVLDVKRGDIGSTMEGYAQAYLADGSPLAADAATFSPYLGVESLRPALALAARHGRGVFVLARTSNPEGAGVQLATPPDGAASVAQAVVDAVAAENGARVDDGPIGSVGLVVGATATHGLRLSGVDGPILAPGLGAQGATPADVAARFGPGGLLLPASARGVLAAGPDPAALRGAAESLAGDVAAAFLHDVTR